MKKENDAMTPPRNTRIRILSTSDLHGTIYPYSYADHTEKQYGLARLKTRIDSLRDENTIVIDNGDVLEGSPLLFYHFETRPHKESPITRAMRAVGYDYINLGNHDFNYGMDALLRHIEGTGAVCLTANLRYREKPLAPRYEIREIAGKRIALFGLTTQYIPHWENPANIAGVTFQDACVTAQEIVSELTRHEKPDYTICVYHGGFECDPETGRPTEADTGENEAYRILKRVHGIDVLILGHQHRAYCGKLFDAVYTQPAANGKYLSCIDIDTVTGEITPQILPADTAPDTSLTALVQEEEDACQVWLDQTLGTCAVDLRVTDEFDARLHKSQLVTFLNLVQREVTGADLSASPIFLGATGFDREITMRALVSTYVFPNTLVVKRITGKILRAYLEKDASFWTLADGEIRVAPTHDFPTPQHYNYDMIDGVEYTIKVSNPVGERIVSLTRNGEPVTDEMSFTLVINNYRASGGGNYDMIGEAPVVSENLSSMVDLLARYILEHKVIDFPPVHNIKVLP